MSADRISLLGWDTANAVTLDVLNRAIVAQRSTPQTYDQQNAGVGQQGSITGTWEDWQVVPGDAGGNILHVRCPVRAGTGTRVDRTTADLSSVVVEIELRLAQVPGPRADVPGPSGSGASPTLLVADAEGTEAEPAVSVVAFQPANLRNDFALLFADWFNANLAKFTNVFHVVLLNEKAAKDGFQFLMPTRIGYAVADGKSDAEDVFAVLAITDREVSGPLAEQVEADLLAHMPATSNSVFAISAERIAAHFLLAGAVALMEGSSEDEFELVQDGLGVRNKNEVVWRRLKLSDGNEVAPTIPPKGMQLRVEGHTIVAEFTNLSFDYPGWSFPGKESVKISLRQRVFLDLVPKGDGTFVLHATNKDPNDPDAEELPNFENLSITVELDEAARTFENALLGLTVALSAVCVGSAAFVGGKWALAAWAARGANSAAQGAGDVGLGVFAAEGSELQAAARAGIAEDVANGTNQYVPGPVPGNQYDSVTSALQGLNASAAGSYGQLVLAPLATFWTRWAIGAAVLGVASGAGAIAAGISLGVAQGKKLAEGDVTGVASLSELLDTVFGASSWPATEGWTLQSARLAQSLLLYGRLEAGVGAEALVRGETCGR